MNNSKYKEQSVCWFTGISLCYFICFDFQFNESGLTESKNNSYNTVSMKKILNQLRNLNKLSAEHVSIDAGSMAVMGVQATIVILLWGLKLFQCKCKYQDRLHHI